MARAFSNKRERAPIGNAYRLPSTSTRNVNCARSLKQIEKGTSTNSPGLSTPSTKPPVFGTVNTDPAPPGPPSAFFNRSPFVKLQTFVSNRVKGWLLRLVRVATKLKVPTKPAGHPDVSLPVLKVEPTGAKETRSLIRMVQSVNRKEAIRLGRAPVPPAPAT